MIYCFYIPICFGLIILQTAVLAHWPLTRQIYDLQLAFVLYLGLFRPVRESLPVVLLVGVFMDGLSGAPFGLYLTTYFWLFMGLKQVARMFDLSGSIFFPFTVVIGVIAENLMTFGAALVNDATAGMGAAIWTNSVTQVIWALLTGPIVIVGFQKMHHVWDLWQMKLAEEKNGLSG